MTNSPAITVCLPTFNSEEFIHLRLESLLNQSYPNLLIHIFDDNSNDRTLEICKHYALQHENIKVKKNPIRLGWVGNSNALINSVESDFMLFAYHDDTMSPEYISETMQLMLVSPDAVIVYSDLIETTPDGTVYNIAYEEFPKIKSCTSRVKTHLTRKLWYVPTIGLMRTQAVKSAGGLRLNMAGEFAADFIWLLELSAEGEFRRVPKTLYQKSVHSGNLANTWKKSIFAFLSLYVAAAIGLLRLRTPLTQRIYLFAYLFAYLLIVFVSKTFSRIKSIICHKTITTKLASK